MRTLGTYAIVALALLLAVLVLPLAWIGRGESPLRRRNRCRP